MVAPAVQNSQAAQSEAGGDSATEKADLPRSRHRARRVARRASRYASPLFAPNCPPKTCKFKLKSWQVRDATRAPGMYLEIACHPSASQAKSPAGVLSSANFLKRLALWLPDAYEFFCPPNAFKSPRGQGARARRAPSLLDTSRHASSPAARQTTHPHHAAAPCSSRDRPGISH